MGIRTGLGSFPRGTKPLSKSPNQEAAVHLIVESREETNGLGGWV